MSDDPGKKAPPEDESGGIVVRDRRFWVRDAAPGGPRKGPRSSPYPSYVEELRSKAEESAKQLEEAQSGIRKAREEGEALRRRLTRDMDRRLEMARGEYLNGFLDVLDNLDLALRSAEVAPNPEAFVEGIRMVRELFLHRLAEFGLEPVSPEGEAFDPAASEAIGVVAVDDPGRDGMVIEVVRRGFTIGGQVLRAAHVRVGRYDPGTEAPVASEVEEEAAPAEPPPGKEPEAREEEGAGPVTAEDESGAAAEDGPEAAAEEDRSGGAAPDPGSVPGDEDEDRAGSPKGGDRPISPADVEF